MTHEERKVVLDPQNRLEVLLKFAEAGIRKDIADDLLHLAEIGYLETVRRPEALSIEIAEANKILDKMDIPQGENHDGGFVEYNLAGRLDYVTRDLSKPRYDRDHLQEEA